MGRTYYYSDELNDDFAENNIKVKELPADHPYFPKSPIRRAWAFVLHHFIATPLVFVLQKIAYGEKIVGREKLRPYKKTGFYLYGNHTRSMGDAYMPSLVCFPRKPYIIVGPAAVSVKGIGNLVEDLGALPLASSVAGKSNFHAAMRRHAELGHIVAIYPEAHIWPGYTGIRRFRDGSFRYPVEYGKPVFTATCTYHKRRLLPGARCIVYVDGPFFAEGPLGPREARAELCREAYEAMVERASTSTYSPNSYVYAEKTAEGENN